MKWILFCRTQLFLLSDWSPHKEEDLSLFPKIKRLLYLLRLKIMSLWQIIRENMQHVFLEGNLLFLGRGGGRIHPLHRTLTFLLSHSLPFSSLSLSLSLTPNIEFLLLYFFRDDIYTCVQPTHFLLSHFLSCTTSIATTSPSNHINNSLISWDPHTHTHTFKHGR